MPDEIRVSRPGAQMPGMAPQTEPEDSGSKKPWIVLILVIIVIAVLGVLFRGQLFGSKAGNKITTSNNSASSSAEYQAVFLTNGQVYFGKISSPEATYVTMNDIY